MFHVTLTVDQAKTTGPKPFQVNFGITITEDGQPFMPHTHVPVVLDSQAKVDHTIATVQAGILALPWKPKHASLHRAEFEFATKAELMAFEMALAGIHFQLPATTRLAALTPKA